MAKQFFRKILCLTLGLSILTPQVAYTTAQSSPAVLVRNKDHFEPEQSAGDKFQNLGREEFTDANNHASDYDYDALGWLSKVTNLLGFVTKHTYDANGNVIKTERQADVLATVWQATEFTYDILNKLKTVKDPLNRVTTYNYDNNENLASVVDAEGNTTSYVYDERDLLFTVTDANTPAGVTTYDYDLNGNLAKITDANNNPTTYTYDLFDRLDITQYANSSLSNFDYDKNSNLTRHTTPSGKPIEYVYDALNRLTAKTFPLTPALSMTYAYDLGSRLSDANNSAALIHSTYDNLNRIDTNTQTMGSLTPLTISYDYDKIGNRTKAVYPSAKAIDYTYDVNNRMDLVKVNNITLSDYDYDPLDRRTAKTYNLTPNNLVTSYQFDIANQLSQIKNEISGGGLISRYDYPLYDNVGNRKTLQLIQGAQPQQTINYEYNDIYELTSVTGDQTHAYDYDNVANREVADGVSYTANSLNQYASVGATTYLYDANGNLTSDGTNTYTYDEENRLTIVSNSLHTAQYAYDAFNRRTSKTVDGTTTYFIQDGDREIEERDSSGVLLADYTFGDSIDEVLTMTRGSNTYYYHYDGLGSVTEVTDPAGAIVESYQYDPYGQSNVAVSAIGNPFQFTGRRLDEESGLYFYRARHYDSNLGRFLQRDPIGYFDSTNLYVYVRNNSINGTDPYGKWIVQVAGGLIGGTVNATLYYTIMILNLGKYQEAITLNL